MWHQSVIIAVPATVYATAAAAVCINIGVLWRVIVELMRVCFSDDVGRVLVIM